MRILHGDCRDLLPTLPDASVDSVVTDPPYELGFMGKGWDAAGIAYDVAMWAECLRVLKPGGHLLAFGGSRTWYRLVVAIEDAGFEVRDSITWLYASGFPKSLDVSKAIDKAAGAAREVVGSYAVTRDLKRAGSDDGEGYRGQGYGKGHTSTGTMVDITAPATPAAQQWQGWGTALKPAHEPICVARKPLAGTVAATVLTHGTGALNIDGCRVMHATPGNLATSQAKNPGRVDVVTSEVCGVGRPQQSVNDAGRWPSNVVLTHAPDCGPDDAPGECVEGCPVAELDAQSGNRPGGSFPGRTQKGDKFSGGTYAGGKTYGGRQDAEPRSMGDSGGASRFFPTFRYQAKAPTRERPKVDGAAHPTVKPLTLIRWLVRLVTPPGGTVLDPFLGSGTTAEAALLEGFDVIGCELTADYLPLIAARLARLGAPQQGLEVAPAPSPTLAAFLEMLGT